MGNKLLVLLSIILLTTQVFSFTVEKKQDLSLSDLIQRKKSTFKCDIFGRQVRTSLQQKGIGITEGQETKILALMKQAASYYSEDLVTNAKYIAAKIEDDFGGKWNVEIFGGDPSWGRSTHIGSDKWLLYFAWGDFELDYIIWVPDC